MLYVTKDENVKQIKDIEIYELPKDIYFFFHQCSSKISQEEIEALRDKLITHLKNNTNPLEVERYSALLQQLSLLRYQRLNMSREDAEKLKKEKLTEAYKNMKEVCKYVELNVEEKSESLGDVLESIITRSSNELIDKQVIEKCILALIAYQEYLSLNQYLLTTSLRTSSRIDFAFMGNREIRMRSIEYYEMMETKHLR